MTAILSWSETTHWVPVLVATSFQLGTAENTTSLLCSHFLICETGLSWKSVSGQMHRSGIKVVCLAWGAPCAGPLGPWQGGPCTSCAGKEGRTAALTPSPSLPRQWPAGRRWTAPRWQLTSQRSTVRSATGAGTAPKGSGTDKALAASARTQANTWASSSNSELLPRFSLPGKPQLSG